MKPLQSSDDVLARALRADARRMVPAFSQKLHEDTLSALNAGPAPGPHSFGKIRRSGPVFWGPVGFAVAAMGVVILLVWLAKPNADVPNTKLNSHLVASAGATPDRPKLTDDDLGPVRLMNSPGELMTRGLTIAQRAICEQYAMTYASTVRSAQKNLPQFEFYSVPDGRATSAR